MIVGASFRRHAPAWAVWVLGVGLILAAWWSDAVGLAALVWTHDTYSYGLWVPVISLWLVWRRRAGLEGQSASGGSILPGALALFAAAGLWLLGSLFDAALPRHLALVTALQGVTIVAFGWPSYRRFLFPMLFLYLMVPFGEPLIPPLQTMTAEWTIRLLRLVGIPVTSDGVLLTLPSGAYEVARACAGVQFLFTSLVVSVLIAHLVFRSWKKRCLMVFAGVLVPLVANVLRVFSILLVSEATSQQFAKSIDHIVYGWVFLSIILFILIAVAYKFADSPGEGDEPTPGSADESKPFPAAVLVVSLPLFLLPMVARLLVPPVAPGLVCPLPALSLPECKDCSLRRIEAQYVTGWPVFQNPDQQDKALYRDAGTRIQFYRALYSPERPGHRLSSAGNRIAGDGWALLPGQSGMTVQAGGHSGEEFVLWRGDDRRLVWQFKFIDGHGVTAGPMAKLWAGVSRLRRGYNRAAVLVVSTDMVNTREHARAAIRNFLSTFPPDTILWSGVVKVDEDRLCAASAGY